MGENFIIVKIEENNAFSRLEHKGDRQEEVHVYFECGMKFRMQDPVT